MKPFAGGCWVYMERLQVSPEIALWNAKVDRQKALKLERRRQRALLPPVSVVGGDLESTRVYGVVESTEVFGVVEGSKILESTALLNHQHKEHQ